MKKLLSISATALLTIFSCQNDSELANNTVPEQSLSNPKTSSNGSLLAATAATIIARDDFNSLSTTNWTTIVDTKPIMASMDPTITVWKNVASNAYVNGSGQLVLRSEKINANTIYTARLESNGKLFDRKFGYVEARMKVCDPATTHVQSSFWFYTDLQTSTVGGTDGAEIDVFESTNKLDRYPTTMHIDDGFSEKHEATTYTATGSTTGYHTYGMEWFSTYIDIYYDRVKVASVRNGDLFRTVAYNWVPTVNEYAILSVAPAWGNAASGYGSLPVGSKSYTYVDYIIWYDKKPF